MKSSTKAIAQRQLSDLKGVGEQTLRHLASLNIFSVEDLLFYFPRRYDDFSHIVTANQARPGPLTIRGKIHVSKGRYSQRGLHITEGYVEDSTGRIPITWFNQPYRARSIHGDQVYYVSGQYDLSSMRLCFTNPIIEPIDKVEASSRIIGRYKDVPGLSSHQIRKLVEQLLNTTSIDERLPMWLVEENNLLLLSDTVREMHLPSNSKSLQRAQYRLSFEELTHLQLASALSKSALKEDRAIAIPFESQVAKKFVAALDFEPTDDQRRVVWQIYQDLQMTEPMNRLVEGDVGSGKTVVAAMAAAMVLHAGFQVLYMAPTELLARQHAETFSNLLAHTEWSSAIGLLIGSSTKKQKHDLYQRISGGECRLVIGTHALLQEKVVTENVGLVIIDEQHRFGVEQRQKLRQKGGYFPHVLCMTATPIPRTLALTLYGELDISIIRSSPEGRLPVVTEVVKYEARASVYQKVDEQIAAGRQAFIVTPLIAESSHVQAQAAESLYQELSSGVLKHRRLALLHGAMRAEDKDKVMQQFVKGAVDAIVSTTVIEVGVNVPNATVMVVEGAERFGLAQLHQLRGRVGRGVEQGYCYLVPSQDMRMTKRLRAIAMTNDGFKLAELDLELRGPGAIYGSRQSGALDLTYANLSDRTSIQKAKQAAAKFIDKQEILIQYPYMAERVEYFQSVSRLN